MTSQWTVAAACALALAWPSSSAGQSLADVARQEAARRQTVARGKVITNDDLKPVPPAAAAPASAPGTTLPPPPALDKALPSGGEQKAAAEPAATVGEKKDEKYWRARVATARDNLARAQTFEVALQARIAALSLDFVNRDDPAQRSRVEADRVRAVAELDRVKKEILQHQTDLTTIATDARQAGVPAGWVR